MPLVIDRKIVEIQKEFFLLALTRTNSGGLSGFAFELVVVVDGAEVDAAGAAVVVVAVATSISPFVVVVVVRFFGVAFVDFVAVVTVVVVIVVVTGAVTMSSSNHATVASSSSSSLTVAVRFFVGFFDVDFDVVVVVDVVDGSSGSGVGVDNSVVLFCVFGSVVAGVFFVFFVTGVVVGVDDCTSTFRLAAALDFSTVGGADFTASSATTLLPMPDVAMLRMLFDATAAA